MSVTTIAAVQRPDSGAAHSLWLADGGRRALTRVVLPILLLAAVAWVYTTQMSGSMSMTFAAFTSSWLVMMVAMMLPAVAPVVALYVMAARRRVVASVPVFLAGYLLVWAVSALPAYAMSRVVSEPLMRGSPWLARLAGAALLTAAAYQLTPWKDVCLRHCRSPLSSFLSRTRGLSQNRDAFAAGATHGLYCLGCCWALMAVLIVLGGMQLGWALVLAAVITVEKLAPWGALAARLTALTAAGLGIALIAAPALLQHLVAVPVVTTPM